MAPFQGKNYQFFLDETGDHGLTFIDEKFPLFLLVGCLFEEQEYLKLYQNINILKQELFKTTQVVLHSRDIRRCEGAFQIFFDLETKKKFYEGLNYIVSNANFTIIAIAINKKKYIEHYGKQANNPYSICMSYILERLIYCTDTCKSNSVNITIEKRGKKEDKQLLSHYNSIIDRGTYHVSAVRFNNRIKDFLMKLKKDNDIGLQVADLCAYPIARYILNSEEPYIPFKIIENKLRRRPDGKMDGYGIKIFP
ncbi:MAG: DUF3800 domain-containing protein [Candidatus Pacebacteria bacterium]|nr:DUF3800 domain-containing protein [Candidatus Paceibacterota bacterium]